MIGPVVVGPPVASKVLLVGQAPGPREGALGRPFAWTAGRQLFRWFAPLGVDEAGFRARVYMSAVCRCFPGKGAGGGGDRVPAPDEVAACRPWLDAEVRLLRPALIVPVGRLAIAQLLPDAADAPLAEVIGRAFRGARAGRAFDVIPLPHPSGASTWFRRPPGDRLLRKALRLVARHPAWAKVSGRRVGGDSGPGER